MRIQIAPFALVPEHIYIAEKNFHPEKLVLILSDENKEGIDENSKKVRACIGEVSNFYEKLKIPVQRVYVDYKQFMKMTLKLATLLNGFSVDDEILLNLSGGRRSIPIALIYAGTFISNLKNMNIKCVVIPEDKTYDPFNLIPSYFPDKKDIKLMSKLSENLTLTELENFLGIKQPTISTRLKNLETHGYVIIEGRNRKLTNLGELINKLHNFEE